VLTVNSASQASQQHTSDPASTATRLIRGDWQRGQYKTTNGERGSRPKRVEAAVMDVLKVFRVRTKQSGVEVDFSRMSRRTTEERNSLETVEHFEFSNKRVKAPSFCVLRSQ